MEALYGYRKRFMDKQITFNFHGKFYFLQHHWGDLKQISFDHFFNQPLILKMGLEIEMLDDNVVF